MSEYPTPNPAYYVCEQFTLENGKRLTDFAAGPFEHPDEARRARDAIRAQEPSRCVHCTEWVDLTREGT